MSTEQQSLATPEKVTRFYTRILGNSLVGKQSTKPATTAVAPSDESGKPASASNATTTTTTAAKKGTPTTPAVETKLTSVKTTTSLAGSDYILLYFSGSWCPPCKVFTPILKTFHAAAETAHLLSVTESADRAEAIAVAAAADAAEGNTSAAGGVNPAVFHKPKVSVIFVSADKTNEDAEEYFKKEHGDWLMIPFAEAKVRDRLCTRFEVTSVPALVILNAKTGKIITKAGARALRNDPEGEDFPWKPKSIVDILVKDVEVTKQLPKPLIAVQTTVALTGTSATTAPAPTTKKVDVRRLEHFAVYVASHHSAPCRAFTPLLAAIYEDTIMKNFGEDRTEIIFVSQDKSEEHYNEFRSQMPWASIPFQHPAINSLLKELQINSVPALVTINASDGKILNADARAAVGEETEDFSTNDLEDVDETNPKENSSSFKSLYPWSRTKLAQVAPLVGSREVVTAIKEGPCIVLATNNAPNAAVLITEFNAAAALVEEAYAKESKGSEDSKLDTYEPERDSENPNSLTNESRLKRVQFFIADSSHVGSSLFLQRLVMVLQENLPPSGEGGIFSLSLRENKSAGMLKTIQRKEIVDYTQRFVTTVEEAAAASPAKNLAALQTSSLSHRPRPQPNQGNAVPTGESNINQPQRPSSNAPAPPRPI